MSSSFGATFGARRRYLSMSLDFAVPARSRRKSSAARKEPTFSATAAAINWLSDTPSLAANSAAAFFTDVGSFNGYVFLLIFTSQTDLSWTKVSAAIPSSRRPRQRFAASAPCEVQRWFGSPRVERLPMDRCHIEEI